MPAAKTRALALRERYRLRGYISDDDIDRVIRGCRLCVEFYPFTGRNLEVLYRRVIGIRSSLDHAERRWLIVHGLAHHLLHRGGHLCNANELIVARQERQAEVFAGWFFLADTWQRMTAWALAAYHVLPEWRIRRWLGLMQGQIAVSAGW